MILRESWHDDAVLYNTFHGQGLSWKSNSSSPSQDISSSLCAPYNYFRFHYNLPLFPILSLKNPIHAFPNDFLKIHIGMFPIYAQVFQVGGPGSVVGIATGYGAGRFGDRIPVGARFSTPVQTGPGTHPASCTMGTGSFLGEKAAGASR